MKRVTSVFRIYVPATDLNGTLDTLTDRCALRGVPVVSTGYYTGGVYVMVRMPSDDDAVVEFARTGLEAPTGFRVVTGLGVNEREVHYESPSLGTPLVEILRANREWSLATFGPEIETERLLKHIGLELDEIRKDPLDLVEWVDVALLAFDGAWRAGYSPEEVALALVAKSEKNRGRTWAFDEALGIIHHVD